MRGATLVNAAAHAPPVASLKYTLMRSSCRSLSPQYCSSGGGGQAR